MVVRGKSDDDTLAATLAVNAAAPGAHLVAHFQEEGAARLIRSHLSNVEIITSLATDLLVRAARDPGASRLAALMFSSETEDTAFSMQVPEATGTQRYDQLLYGFKQRHDLTLLGVCRQDDRHVDLNCPADRPVRPGNTLFYIADRRADPETIDWRAPAKA